MELKVEYRSVEGLRPYVNNPRVHSREQVEQIMASIREFGWTNPILIDGEEGVIAGHGRLIAAARLGMTDVPVIVLSHLTQAQRRALVIADNQLAMNAGWNTDLLKLELEELGKLDFDLSITGFSADQMAEIMESAGATQGVPPNETLAERFIIPPFSVLNARDGWWQDRKRAWLQLGLRSGRGRGDKLLQFSETATIHRAPIDRSNVGGLTFNIAPGAYHGREESDDETALGTSIFDAVLCEIIYRWFSGAGAKIIDPFAGGSVRGIVAAALGRAYYGVDLSADQIAANCQQWLSISPRLPEGSPSPAWSCGDGIDIRKLINVECADLLFSCPPYADLERYSDDPRDISTMPYPEFREKHAAIINAAVALLGNDRFAVWVVGEARGKDGSYYGLVPDTIEAFRAAGLQLYNEAILVTQVGSLPIRVGAQFTGSRKLGKTHQNVLVFIKGDARKATAAAGAIDMDFDFGEVA